MIKLPLLAKLLNITDDDIKKLTMDQLRVLLGVFRYLARVIEREINTREPNFTRKKN
jgi:hypothetical protein